MRPPAHSSCRSFKSFVLCLVAALAVLGPEAATGAPPTDTTAPTSPSRLAISSAGVTTIAISWRRSSDRGGVAGYTIYRNDARVGSTSKTSYTATGLRCGTSYRLGVEAYDRAGNRSARATVLAATVPCTDTRAPSPPNSVWQIGVSTSSITVGWSGASDDRGIVRYDLLQDGALHGSTAATSYAFAGLSCGTMYTLGVSAVDAAGNRSPVASVLMSTASCPDTTAPSPPGGLAVTARTVSSVSVSWSASSDNVGVTGYGVYRDGADAGSTTLTSYTVSGLACGTTYQIGVDAWDGAGNTSARSTVAASTSACAPPVPPPDTGAPTAPTGLTVTGATATSVSLRWTASTDDIGVAGYGLYRDGTSAGSTSGTTATFSSLACGRSYTLAVDAYDAAGRRSARTAIVASTSPCSDTTPPSAPTQLTQAGSTETSVSLGWATSTDNVGVVGYGVYLAGVRVGSVSTPGYTFAALACGMTYTVGVDAYDAAGGRSAQANLVVATRACPTSPPPASGLVAAYSFDAGSGTTLADASGNGNAGTISGASWTTSGRYGSALSFDGTGDSVAIGDSSSLDLTTGMTLSAWVRPSDASRWRNVFFKEHGSGMAYSLYTSEYTGRPVGQVNIGGERNAFATPLPLNQWSYVAATFNGSMLRIYVNGLLGSEVAVAGSIPVSTGALKLGGNSVFGEWFAGQIDNARIYNRALGVAELQTDMATPIGTGAGTPPPPPPPSPDTQAPTVPAGLNVTASTTSSISVSWSASSDNVGVAGYRTLLNGSPAGTTQTTSYTFNGLACGTSYSLGVDAYDAAGNRSATASTTRSTAACTTPPPPPPPASGTANLWIDPNGGSCIRQASPAPYSDGQACASMNTAYAAAQAGDVILMKGGTYANQPDILNRSNLPIGSAPVVLHPAPGENVVTDSFDIRTHDLIIDGGDTVRVNEPNRFRVNGQGPRSIDVENVNVIVEDVHTRNFYFASTGDNSTLRYSEVGPSSMNPSPFCGDLVLTDRVNDAVVEYNLIHDNLMAGCNGAHIDALDLNMVNGVIRGNRIWWCGTQCLFTGDPGSMLIENNMIEETNACNDCGGPAELALMGTNTVRYNTIEGGTGYGLPDRPGNSTVYGNLFLGGPFCQSGVTNVSVTFSFNVWLSGSGCGISPRVCVPRLADGNLWTNTDRQADFHLAANDTCAVGAGNPTLYPAHDLDEQSRPQGGGTPDAGADER